MHKVAQEKWFTFRRDTSGIISENRCEMYRENIKMEMDFSRGNIEQSENIDK